MANSGNYKAPHISPENGLGTERLRQFQRDGFCVVPGVADEQLLKLTRACAERAIAIQNEERLTRVLSLGLHIDSYNYPELAGLISNPRALGELARMGFTDIKFWKAVIISKPPGGPRLYWHQDCILWQDQRSYSHVSPMIALMYYLEDTSRHNGCLRVIPGSHRSHIDLHEIGVAHEYEIKNMQNPDDPRFADRTDEIDVPVKAGDLVIGDARMFHAAHSNQSDQWRTVITVWFFPLFTDLIKSVQSFVHHEMHNKHEDWPASALAKIDSLIPRYSGDVAPMEIVRTPDERLLSQKAVPSSFSPF